MCSRDVRGSDGLRGRPSRAAGISAFAMAGWVALAATGCVAPHTSGAPSVGWAFSGAPLPQRAVRPAPPGRLPDGARVIRVSLPVQSKAGICAPVVVSGLLAHYSIDVSPTWLERRAGTTSKSGTNVQRILDIVREDILPGSGADLHEHLGFGTERFTRLFLAYNRLADAHSGARRIFWTPGAEIRVDRALARADPALLRKAANAMSGRGAFWNAVRKSIDRGDPLLWGVVIGILDEPGLPSSQPPGGHLRLIVGYRDSPREIVFADPWGPAHAAKRLPLADAWAETATLHSFQIRPAKKGN